MGYYSDITNKDIINIAVRWIDLENVMISEVTQSQTGTYAMYSVTLLIKCRSSMLQCSDPKKLGNKEVLTKNA